MSGFIVVLSLDRRPVDPSLLAQMSQSMAFRGPDEQQTWVEGNVGLGCALLRTTDESRNERQPFTLDSRSWIVGDVRLDGRDDLIRKLGASDHTDLQCASDIELILHTYRRWGEGCVEHLIGDFAFAIWDKQNQRLFCARDHIGIKPFFYACLKNACVLSNTLNALRLYPEISGELNESAIGDFLLFNRQEDLAATIFRDVLRLPPAHTLSVSRGAISLGRYWKLPLVPELRYKGPQQYLDHFHELLRNAVADRLRTDKVSVLMSGGLDSTALAATARDLMHDRASIGGMRTFCVVHTGMFDDPEQTFAAIAARHLKIPLDYISAADGARLYAAWDDPQFSTPEPLHDPLFGNLAALNRALVSQGRVVLDGYDGDTLLECDFAVHLRKQFLSGHLGRLFNDLLKYMWLEQSFPKVEFRTWLKHRLSLKPRQRADPFKGYPHWLNPEFERQYALRERWLEITSSDIYRRELRPGICRMFNHPIWPWLMDLHDAGVTLLPLEYRHPLCDLRLIAFCQGLPPMPWLFRKGLLRVAMRGVLPDAILARPKTPLVAHPFLILLKRDGWKDVAPLGPVLRKYVQTESIPRETTGDPDSTFANLSPMSLGLWLLRNGAKKGR